MEKIIKICFIASSPMTLRVFMRNHLEMLSKNYDITIVADFGLNNDCSDWISKVDCVSVKIVRNISFLSDICSCIALFSHFRSCRYDVVHSVTPKAGLLAMTSALCAGVPRRIHCFTGQVWATRKGFWRKLLKQADKLIVLCASDVLVDSLSQRDFLEVEGVLKPGKAVVLGHGSISGVDHERFCPDRAVRARIRHEVGVPQDAVLFAYVGRLNRDKGVLDLARAFSMLARKRSNAWFLIVGPDEAGITTQIFEQCGHGRDRVVRVDYTSNPEHYMVSADVFVLPSYREGFGSVIIEAAACGVPAVASRIYGLSDAVVDNETGLLFPVGDVSALFESMLRLHDDTKMREEMGVKARERAISDFSMEYITSEMLRFYDQITK